MELEMEWTRWENGSLVFPAGLTSWTETFECAFLFSAKPAPSVRHRRRYRRRLSVRARGQTHARTDTLSPGGGGAFLFEFFFDFSGFYGRVMSFFSYFSIVVDCGSYRLPRCWPTTAPQSTCRGLDVSVVPNETKTKRKKKQQQQKKQTNHKKKWSATP